MSEARIDRMVLVRLDGKVYARCYTGKNFTDALISIGCLGNLVADGAKIMVAVLQDQCAKAPTGKPVD